MWLHWTFLPYNTDRLSPLFCVQYLAFKDLWEENDQGQVPRKNNCISERRAPLGMHKPFLCMSIFIN